MTEKIPEYIKLGEGFADITLRRAVEIDGAEVTGLRMREPTVADQLALDKMKGGEAEREITLMANLCEVSPEAIQSLKLADYKRLQEAFRLFLE